MTTGASGRLSRNERAIVVAATMYERRRGVLPTWSEIAQVTGLDRTKVRHLAFDLRRRDVITFENDVPRTLAVRPAGLRQALGRQA